MALERRPPGHSGERYSPGQAINGLYPGGARESGGGPPQSKTLREISHRVRGGDGMTRLGQILGWQARHSGRVNRSPVCAVVGGAPVGTPLYCFAMSKITGRMVGRLPVVADC